MNINCDLKNFPCRLFLQTAFKSNFVKQSVFMAKYKYNNISRISYVLFKTATIYFLFKMIKEFLI